MKNLDLKLGYSCNNNCIHCVITDYKKELIRNKISLDLTTDEILKRINENYNSIVITGGEPTIRKDFLEILEKAKEHSNIVLLQTNGRKFSQKEFIEKIKNISFIPVIALHSYNEEIHDKITRVKGSYKETIEGIKNLVKNNYNVYIKLVISNLNKNDLFETYKLVKNLGAKNLEIAFPHALGNARINWDLVVPRYYELKKEIRKIIEDSKKTNFKVSFEAFPMCILGKGNEIFSSDVKEFYRIQKKIKSIFQPVNKEKKNWDLLKAENRKKFIKCKSCIYDFICFGPWKEYVEKYGDEEFKPL